MTRPPGEGAKSRLPAAIVSGTGNLSRPPVMADVARLAGVSHQTVSRVLNDHPNVRPPTRDKVLAAIRELAYRPNAAARTLVTRRTHTLGVISFDTMLYGPASMLYGFERAAHDAYFVSIASLPALDRGSMLDAVDRFIGQGVEGIIVIATQDTAVAALAHVPGQVPLVAVGCGTRAPVTSVAIDNTAGAAAATRYLLSRGHTTVHHIAGPPSHLDAQERADGWRQTLREAGAPEPAVLAGDWSASSGYELGCELASDPRLTAVFCGNDTMALGLMRAMSERRLRVPADVSIVGFDDVPEAGYFRPPLTTVRQDFGEVGRQALNTLIDRMSGAIAAGLRVRVAPELIIRASAAGPRPQGGIGDRAGPQRPTGDEAGPQRPTGDRAGLPQRPTHDEAGPQRPTGDRAGPQRPTHDEAGPQHPTDDRVGPQGGADDGARAQGGTPAPPG